MSKLNHAKETRNEEKRNLKEAKQRYKTTAKAQVIVQSIGQEVQSQAHSRIAPVVSHCLKTVFGEEAYEFKIHFLRKRGRTEAKLVFIRDGHELNPASGAGIGQMNVAAFALRLACLNLIIPRPRRLIVLDEPFKDVNGEIYQERCRQMLETLATEMKFQFIMVTGKECFLAGKVIEL